MWEVDRQVRAQRDENLRLEQRNASLDAEVRDPKSGNDAIEERARFELGMTRPGEIFVEVPQRTEPASGRLTHVAGVQSRCEIASRCSCSCSKASSLAQGVRAETIPTDVHR